MSLNKYLDSKILSETYVCPFIRQNGGDGLLQEGEDSIPQLFNIPLWIRRKILSEQTFSEKDPVKKEEKETKRRYGTVNFEKRKHPRFNLDLPIEYSRTDLFVKHGRAVNVSEGGLLLYLPERMEAGQHLEIKLFFNSGSKMNIVETLVQVVWIDIHLGEGWGDYRTGVKFVDISPEDLNELKVFLRSLSSP